ncbi:unnamed protein product, partial [Phaeothamnion confervicola]
LTQIVIKKLVGDWRVDNKNFVAIVHDRCGVNIKAMETLGSYFEAVEIGCESHTLDFCCRKIVSAEILDNYVQFFTGLISHSHKAKEYIKAELGVSPPSVCPTRCTYLGALGAALIKAKDTGALTRAFVTCLAAYHKPPARGDTRVPPLSHLKVEAHAVIEFTKNIAEATYLLEGDGLVSLFTYDIIMGVATDINLCFPNIEYVGLLQAIAEVSGGDPVLTEYFQRLARAVLTPAKDYFFNKVITELVPQLKIFHGAALANPMLMHRVMPTIGATRDILISITKLASSSLLDAPQIE